MSIKEIGEELIVLKGKVEVNGEEIVEQKSSEKAKWGSDLEFLCSCITLSVGLGNVWR